MCFVRAQKYYLSKIEIVFHNVELGKLITNQHTCNYPACTVTEILGYVTSKCIVFFLRGRLKKFFLSKIEISVIPNVEFGERITNHFTCNDLSSTVTELFGRNL